MNCNSCCHNFGLIAPLMIQSLIKAAIRNISHFCDKPLFFSFSCVTYSLCYPTKGLETVVCGVIRGYGQNSGDNATDSSSVRPLEEL